MKVLKRVCGAPAGEPIVGIAANYGRVLVATEHAVYELVEDQLVPLGVAMPKLVDQDAVVAHVGQH